jgi:hypothetical protein
METEVKAYWIRINNLNLLFPATGRISSNPKHPPEHAIQPLLHVA